MSAVSHASAVSNASAVSAASDDAPRWPTSQKGHVESWFVRANHPTEPKAVWIKATVLRKENGDAVAEAWCVLFDGDRTFGAKTTVPLAEVSSSWPPAASLAAPGPARPPAPTEMVIDGCKMSFGTDAGASGRLKNARGEVSWDLRWSAVPRIGEPLCLYPYRRMIDGPFPKNKVLTPFPALRVDGSVTWDGARWDVGGWLGMQGHNWGRAHPLEYAWGQCLFADAAGEPFAMVEGFSGRIAIGPVVTPLLSSLVVRRGARTYRFDRVFAPWTQRPRLGDLRWTLRARGDDGDAELEMEAVPERVACLGYVNPDGAMSYCLNSKLARVSLRVNPRNEDGFACESASGGALEILTRTPDPRFPEPV